MALLWSPKLAYSPKGSGTAVRGFWILAFSNSCCGTFSGTFRIPSMSSEKQISRVGMSLMISKARRIIVVRCTSPKVPICGRPDGP